MIEIITFDEKYKDDVVEMIEDIYENELGFIGYDRPDIYSITETYLKKLNSSFWLALNDGKLIGAVGILEKTEKLAYIKRLVVKKEFRRQGLGQKLLQTVLSFAKEHGFNTIYAGTVEENQNAIKFYESQGFAREDNVPEDITAASDSICLRFNL